MVNQEDNSRFLDLIIRSRRGHFKLYIGMIAGVGKTYRMLTDARELIESGLDVKIGYVETHGRAGTVAQLEGLPVIPRKKIFYKGKELEEMDLDAILQIHPDLVIVDELAHSNVEGSRNPKRWQDVMEILNAGINVLSAINIQHIESLTDEVTRITGISIAEKVPDSVIRDADEVVNLDLTSEELIDRLKSGKIYGPQKIKTALDNFFRPDNILQLRELALKEVALRVEKQVESEVAMRAADKSVRRDSMLVCISSHPTSAQRLIRKTARLAGHYNTDFYTLYVQRPEEDDDKISLQSQRHLMNHLELAAELGSQILKVKASTATEGILQVCREKRISTVCMGIPAFRLLTAMRDYWRYRRFITQLNELGVNLLIFSSNN